MNGQEIYDVLSNQGYNDIIARFTDILKDEMNGETPLVATYLIVRDMDTLIGCNNGSDLEEVIIGKAEAWGQYAGLDWDESEWMEGDDGELPCVDDGLRWVAFTDMYITLEQVAKSYSEDK